ncbi:CLUMA_CG000379, isoform A [Clunio marinus]|uniref:CLUMA_CG000379, isoform A n=1 Tax=Clunio marinus TaxID=568069 RepID=A0A1J1HIE0_9DIPT|nr:CLUMA_CG000379, isoform A [Clunio marinus]
MYFVFESAESVLDWFDCTYTQHEKPHYQRTSFTMCNIVAFANVFVESKLFKSRKEIDKMSLPTQMTTYSIAKKKNKQLKVLKSEVLCVILHGKLEH